MEDEEGYLIKAMEREHMKISKAINTQILMEWINGRGKPVEWRVLVQVLNDIGRTTLAKDIQEAL